MRSPVDSSSAAMSSANTPMSGRPRVLHRFQCARHQANRPCTHKPHPVTLHAAGSGSGWGQRAGRRRPVAYRWASVAAPQPIMPGAQPVALHPEPAARHRAGPQRGLSPEPRTRRRRELGQIRAAVRPPPAHVPLTQSPLPARAHTLAHRARRPAEHRIPRVEEQHLGAELRPDRGHQLRQHPGRTAHRPADSLGRVSGDAGAVGACPWRARGVVTQPTATPARRAAAVARLDLLGGRVGRATLWPAHHDRSLPANQPAASNAARASSTVRWP